MPDFFGLQRIRYINQLEAVRLANLGPTSTVPGDIDGDGDVDSADRTTLTQNWTGAQPPGTGGKTAGQGDIDCDGTVGIGDFLALLAAWGVCADCNECPADIDDDCTVGIADFLARVREARQCGFAVDRGTMFQGITHVSVPVLSPSWELLLVLTAAGHAHDFDAVGPLSRAMPSAAARLSESVRLLRLR